VVGNGKDVLAPIGEGDTDLVTARSALSWLVVATVVWTLGFWTRPWRLSTSTTLLANPGVVNVPVMVQVTVVSTGRLNGPMVGLLTAAETVAPD
jgi:hypothetical protein